MSRPGPVARMTYAEYLAFEASSDLRHEFLRGEIFPMAREALEHAALAAAMSGELGSALAGKPCRVYSSDARVRVRETDLSTYPDVSVVCGGVETDDQDPNAILNPIVLARVLSDSTEAYDRGAKASHYRQIPSLREYVLVAQDEPRIEVYRRIDSHRWELLEARAGESIELESLGARLAVDTVFADPLEG